MDLDMCHPFYYYTVLRSDWPANLQDPSDAAPCSNTDRCMDVWMTARGSSTTHTPTAQATEPGESTDAHIYE
jgi:hypothetical protein